MAHLARGAAVTVALLWTTACFDEPGPPCAFLCGADQACPDGYSCRADNWCKAGDVADDFVCDPTVTDAMLVADAPRIDAGEDDAAIDAMPGAPDAGEPDAMPQPDGMPDAMPAPDATPDAMPR